MMATERQTSGRGTACQNLPGLAMAAPALPSTDDIRDELSRERYRSRFLGTFWNTVFVLVVVAAAAVLVAVLLLPVLQIYGTSMSGTLDAGDVVVSVKTNDLEAGDVVAFYYNNNILVKRVIAHAGQWVDIDDDGNVYVDGRELDEPTCPRRRSARRTSRFPTRSPTAASSSWVTTARSRSTRATPRSAALHRSSWSARSSFASGRSPSSGW